EIGDCEASIESGLYVPGQTRWVRLFRPQKSGIRKGSREKVIDKILPIGEGNGWNPQSVQLPADVIRSLSDGGVACHHQPTQFPVHLNHLNIRPCPSCLRYSRLVLACNPDHALLRSPATNARAPKQTP